LWYVLLKEKNKLKSDFLMCKQLGQIFYGHNDLTKVALTMSRLLTVVNERKKLRAEYRIHLENEYVADRKAEELEAFMRKRKQLISKGVKNIPMTPEETRKYLRDRSTHQENKLIKEKEKLLSLQESDEATLAPTMSAEDVEFLATTRVKLSQKEILKMYVGNWQQLDLKQRRKVMGYVQAQRSKHAKEIFLKELSALGRKMNQQGPEALVPDSRMKGKKDPIKLKLEQITLV
jgi:large subunit ribosomal protein L47